MKRRLWNSRWFILMCVVGLFLMATSVRVAIAGTDAQLDKILGFGLNGLISYFDWLIDVLQMIW